MHNLPVVVMSVIFLCWPNLLPGQKKVNEFLGRKGEALNYQLVTETKWPEKGMRVSARDRGSTSAGFPSMAVVEQELPDGRTVDTQVNFYDETGRLTYSRAINEETRLYQQSDKSNFAIFRTELNKEPDRGYYGVEKLELVDSHGRIYWQREGQYYYEGDNAMYYIANDGSTVEVRGMRGIITFMDRAGEVINQVDIFEKDIYDLEGRLWWVKWSQDSRYLAINVSDASGRSFSKDSAVILFDSRGNEQWRYPIDQRRAQGVWISPDNNYVVATNATIMGDRVSSVLIDIHGNLKKTLSVGLNDVVFAGLDDYVALIFEGATRIVVLETATGETVFLYPTSLSARTIYSADISVERKLIGLVTADGLSVFHFNQVPAWSKPLPVSETKAGWLRRPRFRFSQDGSEFSVKLNSGVYRYRLVE